MHSLLKYLWYVRILFEVLVQEKFYIATMRVITYSYPEQLLSSVLNISYAETCDQNI